MKNTVTIMKEAAVVATETLARGVVSTLTVGTALTVGCSVGSKILTGNWNIGKIAADTAKGFAITYVTAAAVTAAMSITTDVVDNMREMRYPGTEEEGDLDWLAETEDTEEYDF